MNIYSRFITHKVIYFMPSFVGILMTAHEKFKNSVSQNVRILHSETMVSETVTSPAGKGNQHLHKEWNNDG